MRGVLNGTANFILARMADDRLTVAEALAEARARGFAEADPSADLSGLDPAWKLVILSRHAFGAWIPPERVDRQGIEPMAAGRTEDAARRGRVTKLVAEAAPCDDGVPRLTVGPRTLAPDDPIAAVEAECNAVEIQGDICGPVLFQGRGAGGRATASALYADLVEAALARDFETSLAGTRA